MSLEIYLFCALIGLVPSIIWLLFYLRKDSHPESKKMVTKIFVWGMVMGPLAAVLELVFHWLTKPISLREFLYPLNSPGWLSFLDLILAAPLIEEFLKYQVVRRWAIKNREFDEPFDAMLYMIISALGFAAIENIIYLMTFPIFFSVKGVLIAAALRFLSATFVHTLASGMLGYWLARSIFEPEKKISMLAKGFGLAIFFHSAYNYLIWLTNDLKSSLLAYLPLSMIVLIITLMAIAVFHNFSLLKEISSICKIYRPKKSIA